jgi:alanine-synthesizing transaminase
MAEEEYRIPVADRLKRLPPYLFGKLNALLYQKRRHGVDIIDLGMGNPTDPPPAEITEKLREAVLDARNHRYSVSIGLYNLRRELSRLYQAHWGVSLDPATEVVATIGSKEGFSHICLALLGPGDTALVPSPAFPIHNYAVILAGASVINVRLAPGPELIKSFVDVTTHLQPRPKVVIVNFPHNPTTMVTDVEFYKELVAFAKKYNVMVISDMAYGLTTFDGYKAPSFLEVPGAKDVGVEFTTMSKPFNMAGWRIGFCAGNPDMCKALAKIKGYYDYGIFQAAQIAAIIGMRTYRDTAPKQALVYQGRRDVLCDGLNRVGWEVEKPQASMFVWAKMPRTFEHMGSLDFAMWLMENAEVSCSPGRGFGDYGEGYLRLALIENEQRLKQAVRQIDRATKKYLSGSSSAEEQKEPVAK